MLNTLFALFVIITVVILLYVLGKETIMNLAKAEGDVDYVPTPKEVIVFVILFIFAQRALMEQFKKKD